MGELAQGEPERLYYNDLVMRKRFLDYKEREQNRILAFRKEQEHSL